MIELIGYPIETWFLVLSLFFPRITLYIAWLNNQIPHNTIPFWGDFFMTLFVPRILILIYIATNIGYGGWFWTHLVFAALATGYNYNRYSEYTSKSKS